LCTATRRYGIQANPLKRRAFQAGRDRRWATKYSSAAGIKHQRDAQPQKKKIFFRNFVTKSPDAP
jgi:hypothetical protein